MRTTFKKYRFLFTKYDIDLEISHPINILAILSQVYFINLILDFYISWLGWIESINLT